MRDSLVEDDRLTTADIARPATARQARAAAMNREVQPSDDSAGQGPIPLPAATTSGSRVANTMTESSAGPLFPEDELHNFRARWDQVQTSFVDEPRQAVEQADSLVANVVKHIAEQFACERDKLEAQWTSGQNINTEDLRQAFKRYRAFFDRLLAI